MRTQSKIFDEAVYKALKGTEPDVAISTTNIEIGAKGGSGLSDLNKTLMINRQGGGPSRHVNTLDVLGYGSPDEYRPYRHYLNKLPNYAKQYIKGMKNKALYETTGLKYPDTTEKDLTKKEVDILKEGIAYGVMSGKDKFANIGTSFEDWGQLGKDKNTRTEAEALVGGASVSWNPETGKYEFIDPYDFAQYSGHEGLPGAYKGRMFESNKLFGIPLALGNILVGRGDQGSPYPGAFKTRIGLTPQKVQDISEKNNFFGVEDRNLSGLEGYSEETKDGVTTSFIDDMAIDTTSGLKHGGQTMPRGLSGLNDSITINGQPHNLAWINRDEASVLKSMGGSGKKVGGIPAYFYDDPGSMQSYLDVADEYPHDDDDLSKYQHIYDPSGEARIDTQFLHHDPSEDLAEDPEDRTTSFRGGVYDNRGLTSNIADWNLLYADSTSSADTSGGDNRRDDDGSTFQDLYDRPELDIYKTKLIERLGVPGMESYMKGLGTSGLRQMVDKFHTGYDFGGPMGTMEGLTRDIGTDYAEKLKLKKLAEELKELKEKNLSDEDFEIRKGEILSRYQGIADDLGGKFIPQKEFKGMYGDFDKTLEKSGLKGTLAGTALDFLKPVSLLDKGISAGLNALTKAFGVVGEFTTPEGKTFRVKDDGTLVEPDMPPDPSSVDEGNIEVKVKDKYDYFGESAPSIVTKEEEKDLGLSDVFKRKSKRPESNIFLSDLLDTIYGEGQGQQMLG